MADFKSCIVEALAKGEIDADAAATAHDAYDDAYAAASETMGPVDADRAAAEATMRKLEAEAIEARRRRQLAVRTRRAALGSIAGLKSRRGYTGVKPLGGGGGSGKPPKGGWIQGGAPPAAGQPGGKGGMAAVGLKRLIENRPGLSGAPGPSVAGRYRAIRGTFDAGMADLIEKFETRTGFDTPGRAEMDHIVREAFGENTGDKAAKALAQAWSATAETARQMFNAAGGSIGKLADWGLPQSHDAAKVREAGMGFWVASILPRLDRAKMIDRMTGQPFTDKRLIAVLGEVWETISAGGMNKGSPGNSGRGALAKQRGEERFLAFRSASDWMAYQAEFGQGDAFQSMMGHLDDMAVDIAQMQILGPNPRHQFEWLADFARREGAMEEVRGVKGARERASKLVDEAELMFRHYNGDLGVPSTGWLASTGAGVRAALTGIMLGSAVIGEIGSGVTFGRMARKFVGLSRNGDMGQLMRLLADPAERKMARRTGFIVEQSTDGFVRASHDNLRLMTVGNRAEAGMNAFARRLPAATIRLQGLTGLVAARKRSLRFEIMGALHDVRGMTLQDLQSGNGQQKALARWLDARGFTETDWAAIRASAPFSPRQGADFLLPSNVGIPELALRLNEAIELETRFASPETTLEAKSLNYGLATTARPGTLVGEIQRSLGMFKGFTTTLTTLYAQEMMLQARARGGNALANLAGDAAGMIIFLTLGGALSIQLREMAKGNDPRPMDDAKFWGAALTQGGGLGMAGDFFYSAQARNGKSAPIAGMGPVGQLGSDVVDLTIGNALEIAGSVSDGEGLGQAIADARVGRDAARFATNYNPLASQWWSRAAFTRLVGDNLQRALDPDAEEAFRQRARRMERETGQEQWWPQGENAPQRAPDLGAMIASEDRP